MYVCMYVLTGISSTLRLWYGPRCCTCVKLSGPEISNLTKSTTNQSNYFLIHPIVSFSYFAAVTGLGAGLVGPLLLLARAL